MNGLFYECVKGRTKCQEKIAVITARADDRTQKDIICGIAEDAFAADTDMVVFSNIYNHWIRGEFLNFENVIYDFLIRAALAELLSLWKRFRTFPEQWNLSFDFGQFSMQNYCSDAEKTKFKACKLRFAVNFPFR